MTQFLVDFGVHSAVKPQGADRGRLLRTHQSIIQNSCPFLKTPRATHSSSAPALDPGGHPPFSAPVVLPGLFSKMGDGLYAQETAVRRELRGVRRGSVLGGRGPGETRRSPVQNQAKRSLQGKGESLRPRDRRPREGVGGGGPGAACGCGIVLRERILNMETAGWTARGTDDRGNHSLQVTKTH